MIANQQISYLISAGIYIFALRQLLLDPIETDDDRFRRQRRHRRPLDLLFRHSRFSGFAAGPDPLLRRQRDAVAVRAVFAFALQHISFFLLLFLIRNKKERSFEFQKQFLPL